MGTGIASEEDIQNLQADLEAIYQWSVDHNMTFNSDKFELLIYKSKSSKELQASTSYSSDNGSTIEEKLHFRDLGVTLLNTATFSQHIHETCIAVKSKISWVLRTFKTRESLPMLTPWKTQIMCHLDYCSQLWSPNKTGDIQSIELLQKAFVRKIRGMSALSYWDQLIKLKLSSLEQRRERYQVIYTWRIIEGHVPNFDCTPSSHRRTQGVVKSAEFPPSPPVLLVLYRQSGFLLSLSRGPACSMYYPRTCGICLAALLRGLSVNWTATWLLYQMSPWCQASPSTGDVTATQVIDWANSPYLHQQDNQLQQHNYLELHEAVTT